MKNKTLPIVLVWMILLVGVMYGFTQVTQNFNVGLFAENLTFTGDQNITRFFNVTLDTFVHNISLTVEGFTTNDTWNAANLTFNVTSIDSSNPTFNREVTDWMNMSKNFFFAVGNAHQISVVYNITVNKTTTSKLTWQYSAGSRMSAAGFVSMNSTIFNETSGLWITVNNSGKINVTRPCVNVTYNVPLDLINADGVVQINMTTFSESGSNGGGSNLCNGVSVNTNNAGFINNNWTVLNGSIENPFLQVGQPDGTNEWEVTGLFTGPTNITINSTIVNILLADNCNCTQCVIDSNICQIPFLFHSDSAGVLEYKNVTGNFSWGLDDCSSFTTHAFNFTLRNELNNSQLFGDVDGTFNSTLDNINFDSITIDKNSVGNFSMCITPPQTSLTVDYELQYSAPGHPERRFSVSNGIADNATDNITLFLLGTADGIFARFRTVDQNENIITGVSAVMRKTIDGAPVVIESTTTDSSGIATFFVDPNTDYDFTFSKAPFATVQVTIRPTSSDIFNIIMGSSQNISFDSLYRGLDFTFRPRGQEIFVDTNYTWVFNVSSTFWTVTGCHISLTDQNETEINSSVGTFNTTFCNAQMDSSVGNASIVRLFGILELNGTNISIDPFYFTQNESTSFKGNASLMVFLDDLKGFTGVGFDSFTLMFIAFVIIFALTLGISKFVGIQNVEGVIVLVAVFVWLFCYLGWLTINITVLPNNAFGGHIGQFVMAYIVSLLGAGFIIQRNFG